MSLIASLKILLFGGGRGEFHGIYRVSNPFQQSSRTNEWIFGLPWVKEEDIWEDTGEVGRLEGVDTWKRSRILALTLPSVVILVAILTMRNTDDKLSLLIWKWES